MSVRALAALSAAALVLSGCESLSDALDPEANPGPCPRALGLYDAARVVNFAGAGRTAADVTYTAEIQGVSTQCRYSREGGPISATLDIDVGYGRGAAASGDRFTYDIFIAITRTDSTVIHKEVFPVEVRFRRSGEAIYRTEEFPEILIPRANATTSGSNFEILVGFEQSPEQIEFNRSGSRFPVPAGN